MNEKKVHHIYATQLRLRKTALVIYMLVVVVFYFSLSKQNYQYTQYFSYLSHAITAYGIYCLVVNKYKVLYSVLLIALPTTFTVFYAFFHLGSLLAFI